MTAARKRPPTTISGTPKCVPSDDAPCSMATLASTTTTRAPLATSVSREVPRCGRIASSSSLSSSTMAAVNHVDQASGKCNRPKMLRCGQQRHVGEEDDEDDAECRASGDLATHTQEAGRPTIIATVPPRRTTFRCSLIRPATTAPRPNSAARLKTFEPRTTPAPTVG